MQNLQCEGDRDRDTFLSEKDLHASQAATPQSDQERDQNKEQVPTPRARPKHKPGCKSLCGSWTSTKPFWVPNLSEDQAVKPHVVPRAEVTPHKWDLSTARQQNSAWHREQE